MRILVIGGTRLIGKHFVPAALSRGHALTLFNRGLTDSGAFDGVEEIHGDRDGGLAPLQGREWDCVLDTCGYVPRVVGASARLLSKSASHYTFISTESVYANDRTASEDETAPVAELADPTVEEVNEETYGGLKALCESEVHRHFAGRALIVRAGLIVGPHDYTDRFPYWVRRVARGGEVLAPAPPEGPVQLIDASDLADWLVRMIESRTPGTFNAVGPEEPLTMAKVLEACREVSGSDARFTWVDPEFLLAAGVEPWTEIPLWMPGQEFVGFNTRDVGKAVSSGLEFRPLTETVRRTLEWDSSRPQDQPLTAGLTLHRESDLLAAWRSGGWSPSPVSEP